MKKLLFSLLTIFLLVGISASAATFKAGDVLEHKAGDVAEDLYMAGGAIDVSGNITGDGVIAGGDISLLGSVAQDAIVAGGTVKIVGEVQDDVRVAGGNVSIANTIGDDLVAAGGFVRVLSDAIIAGDAVIAGGAIVINGTVAGDLTVFGDEVTINGAVNGDVTLKFTQKVILGKDASIAGDLTYSAAKELEIPEGVLIGGEVTRTENPIKPVDTEDFAAFLDFLILGKYLIMLVTGVMTVLVFKRLAKTIVVRACERFWKHTLLGFVALIMTPVAVVLLFATILGVYFGLLLLGTYLLLLAAAKVFSGVVLGAFLAKWIKHKFYVNWKWAIVGITVLQLISLVPVLGWIVSLVFTLTAFGALGFLAYQKIWLKR